MKNELVTSRTDVAEKTMLSPTLGVAFDNATLVKGIRAEAKSVSGTDGANKGRWSVIGNLFKPAFGNLFMLGCLIGLFVLYCCSCVIHAVTFPARRKSS